MNTPEEFDRTWAGPPEFKPLVYRRQIEKDIWQSAAAQNEYRLPSLRADDVVIDIGAHTGAFCFRAWYNGSRRVFGYEANPWNYAAGVENLAACDGVRYSNRAVVRGDLHRAATYRITPAEWNVWQGVGEPVESISLDEIIEESGPARFLKIDCEGSEWPILYTCTRLGEVHEIAGEFHWGDWVDPALPEFAGLPDCTPATLERYLQGLGFATDFGASNVGGVGLFWAVR